MWDYVSSVTNGLSKSVRCQGSNRKNGSVQFQTTPAFQPGASWQVKSVPVSINPLGFGEAHLDPSGWISGLASLVMYLWLHPDILLLVAQYWLSYIIVYFWWIGHLYNQKKERHITCPIGKVSINRVWTMFGLAAWVLWEAIGWWHS